MISDTIFTVITLSYNKPTYIDDAIESILSQTLTEFEYIIVDNSTDKYFVSHEDGIERLVEDDCKNRCLSKILNYKDGRIKFFEEPSVKDSKTAPKDKSGNCSYSAYLLNKYYELARGKYLFFLADDDVVYPQCLETHYNFHQNNPQKKVSYHLQRLWDLRNNRDIGIRGQKGLVYDGIQINPDCCIDGGCVVFEKDCLNYIEKPWLPLEVETSSHSDGIFLSKLAKRFSIYPVDKVLSIHRSFPISCYARFMEGGNQECPKLFND